MKNTIDGIVLQKIDYSETSVILKLLTEKEGVMSFLFQGAKSKKKKGNLIAPLAIVSVEYYKRQDSDLAKISSLEPAVVYKDIPFNPYKSSIVFFMNEVLNQTLLEKEDTADIYLFMNQVLQILDLSDQTANFPPKFLFELTRYLGFLPKMDERPEFFDLQEGSFTPNQPNHPFYLDKEKSAVLLGLSGTKFDRIHELKIDLETRRQLVHDLLSYYRIIFDNFEEIQSLSVLEATFHD